MLFPECEDAARDPGRISRRCSLPTREETIVEAETKAELLNRKTELAMFQSLDEREKLDKMEGFCSGYSVCTITHRANR
jgi:hypothetical protein